MSTKLKIKMGHIEFEYEGDAAYDNEAVKDLFSHMESLIVSTPPGAFDGPPLDNNGNGSDGGNAEGTNELSALAPNTVFARLDVKSGSDMAVAAAAHLQICLGRSTFNRKELLSTLQSATNYYSTTVRSNLSSTLKTLNAQKRINNLANDQMSLAAAEHSVLRTKIAQNR